MSRHAHLLAASAALALAAAGAQAALPAESTALTDPRFHVASLKLAQRIETIRREMGATRISVAFHDHETGRRFRLRADEKYAAASMIKLPVAVAVMDAIQQGRYRLDTPVRMFNGFRSLVCAARFTISRGSELEPRIHDHVGRTMPLGELTSAMIASSSNLGTNVLIDTLGLANVRRSWEKQGIPGIELKRGLGDQWAHDAGIVNTITADGFEELLTRIRANRVVSPQACDWLLGSLFKQQVRSGIPHGLPPSVKVRARVAHKTGNISTVEHDGGLVYIQGRKPYALVVLSEWPGRGSQHAQCLARVTWSLNEALITGR